MKTPMIVFFALICIMAYSNTPKNKTVENPTSITNTVKPKLRDRNF